MLVIGQNAANRIQYAAGPAAELLGPDCSNCLVNSRYAKLSSQCLFHTAFLQQEVHIAISFLQAACTMHHFQGQCQTWFNQAFGAGGVFVVIFGLEIIGPFIRRKIGRVFH